MTINPTIERLAEVNGIDIAAIESIAAAIRAALRDNEHARRVDAAALVRDSDMWKTDQELFGSRLPFYAHPENVDRRNRRESFEKLCRVADWERAVLWDSLYPDEYMPSADQVIQFYTERYTTKQG